MTEAPQETGVVSAAFDTSKLGDAVRDISQNEITYRMYDSEAFLPQMIKLIEADLSEPYTIYTYRFFLHQWPHLSFLVSYLILN